MQAGVQFHLPTYKDVPISELIELAKTARSGGVTQIWVTDNLQSRNAFVVLAALASNIPINLGTAVVVQYFRNPVDVADSVAAISEIMDGTELSIGLARGNPNTPNLVDTGKPVSMLRETAQCLHGLLAGEAVSFADYPTLASYFNFKAVASTGRMPEALRTFDDAATKAGKKEALPKIAEIKLSVSRNKRAARDFAKHGAGRRLVNMRRRGYTPDDFQKLSVALEDVDLLDKAEQEGSSTEGQVTDAMIDAVYVAGEPDFCAERMIEVQKTAQEHGFQQLMFSELGPNVEESMQLLCDEILPCL